MRVNKVIIFSIVVSLFTLYGCDKKDIVSPVDGQSKVASASSHSEPAWLLLPVKEDDSQCEEFTVSKRIRADRREFITFSRRYDGGKSGTVSVACVIVIPKGAIESDAEITMTIDEKFGYVTIQPDLEFDIPAKFTMILKGIDLAKVESNNADFVNFDRSSGTKDINSQRMKVNKETGTIGVYEALITKSSTYGFTSG